MSSSTTQFINALITSDEEEASRLKSSVPIQDLLAIGCRLGDAAMVRDSLKDGASATQQASTPSSFSQPYPPLFLTLNNAKITTQDKAVDALLGRHVSVKEDTKGRAEIVTLLTDAGAKTTDTQIGNFPTVTAWLEDKLDGKKHNAEAIVDALKAAEKKQAAGLISTRRGTAREK